MYLCESSVPKWIFTMHVLLASLLGVPLQEADKQIMVSVV